MRELIDEAHGGMASENCLGVHFFEGRPAIFDFAARHDGQALGERDGVFPGVGLEIAVATSTPFDFSARPSSSI